MYSELTDVIRQQNLPLEDIIEEGTGFRIGDPDFPFALVSRNENHWVHISQDYSLKVESQVYLFGMCMIITHRLEKNYLDTINKLFAKDNEYYIIKTRRKNVKDCHNWCWKYGIY